MFALVEKSFRMWCDTITDDHGDVIAFCLVTYPQHRVQMPCCHKRKIISIEINEILYPQKMSKTIERQYGQVASYLESMAIREALKKWNGKS